MQHTQITNKATNLIKLGTGTLGSIIVSGAGSSWTVQVFDSDNALPPSNAIFGKTAVTVPAAGTVIPFNVTFTRGLIVVTDGSTAGELAVTFYKREGI